MHDLPRYRESPAFSPAERAALDLAVEMARTPTDLPEQLVADLRRHFDPAQLVELTATIAWENYRGRFNRAFGVEAAGFSEGASCALRERLPEG